MRNRKADLFALILFTVLVLLMTYPTIINMGSGVNDLGDPLLNTWIMAWNIQRMISLDFQNYFNANIFFPHKRTLAFSEHLFPQSLVALPALLVSKNPIFAYNFVLLFSFITSGFGMFLLARYLTKNTLSGVIAGIIYAFSPFMFAHLGHMQVITAGGIPLAFLFLHKFFEHEQYKHLFLFTFFFLLQVLANGYYALYLSLFAGLYILLYIISRNKFKDWRFWAKMAVFVFIILAVAGPFFRQYALVRKEMGFARELITYASFTSFLNTSPINRIYGDLTIRFLKPEGQLFPGILAFMLAVFGIIYSLRKNRKKKPIVEKHVMIYSFIWLLSFLFTFGPNGPYILLYKFVPGFDGLRVSSRFHIFVMFSLAVLAAFGMKALFSSLSLKKRSIPIVAILLSILILIEYLSIPIPSKAVPVKEDIPEVYKWLATKDDDFSIIELPLPRSGENIAKIECPRLHYLTYHWKRLVNGYSGYFPPLYYELKKRWEAQSLEQNIKDLKSLGVKYIIIHSSLYEEEEMSNVLSKIKRLTEHVQFLTQLEEAYVYELMYSPGEGYESIALDRSRAIPKRGWKATSNVKKRKTNFALDGDIFTRWDSGPQRKGVFFELDLGHLYRIKGLSLKLGTKPLDYPRGYRIELSTDKVTWTKVAEAENTILPITAFLRANDLSFDIVFPPGEARYIKIINTGEDEVYYWSIYEMDIFE